MTLGRPRQFLADEAITQAMEQFWSKGYEGTSLQDLLAATGLSKSSLYQTFGNKHALFLKCIHQYERFIVGELNSLLNESANMLAFFDGLFDMIVEEAQLEAKRKGCFLTNIFNEFGQCDKDVAKATRQAGERIAAVLYKAIEQGRVDKTIGAKQSTQDLVFFLLTNMNGIRTMVKAGADMKQLESVKIILLEGLAGA